MEGLTLRSDGKLRSKGTIQRAQDTPHEARRSYTKITANEGENTTCFIKFCPSLSVPRQTFLTTGISTLLSEYSVLWWMAVHDSQRFQDVFCFAISLGHNVHFYTIYLHIFKLAVQNNETNMPFTLEKFSC